MGNPATATKKRQPPASGVGRNKPGQGRKQGGGKGGGSGTVGTQAATGTDGATATMDQVQGQAQVGPMAWTPAERRFYHRASSLLKIMSDPTRLQILHCLAQNGRTNVTDLCAALGQTQPAISHHLAHLRSAEYVLGDREGKFNFYELTDKAKNLFVPLWEAIHTPSNAVAAGADSS